MRGSATRALPPALLVLALVGLTAVAARGSTPSGTAGLRRPSDILLDTLFTLGLLAFLPAVVLVVYSLLRGRQTAPRRNARLAVASWILLTLSLAAAVALGNRNWNSLVPISEPPTARPSGGKSGPGLPFGDENGATGHQAHFAWIPVAVAASLAVLAAVAYSASRRRGQLGGRRAEALSERLADALDETLDDLRAEPDARRAVIAAYARLERVLAARGFRKQAAETPWEYLERILTELEIDPSSVERLTDLFSRAKFSQHDVDQAMKTEAIHALEQVRDELRRTGGAPRKEPETSLASAGAGP